MTGGGGIEKHYLSIRAAVCTAHTQGLWSAEVERRLAWLSADLNLALNCYHWPQLLGNRCHGVLFSKLRPGLES